MSIPLVKKISRNKELTVGCRIGFSVNKRSSVRYGKVTHINYNKMTYPITIRFKHTDGTYVTGALSLEQIVSIG